MVGCGSKTSNLCLVPKAENSAVCAVADKLGVTPEDMDKTLLALNVGALEMDLYTAQEAKKYLDVIIKEIEIFREAGPKYSYLDAINYLNEKLNALPPRVQVAFIIFNPQELSQYIIENPLTQYDYDLILLHLVKQRMVVSFYMSEEGTT